MNNREQAQDEMWSAATRGEDERFKVETHTARMTGAFWWIVTEDGSKVDDLPYFDDYDCARAAADDEQEARDLAANDCQMWDNLPPSAKDRYRQLAQESE